MSSLVHPVPPAPRLALVMSAVLALVITLVVGHPEMLYEQLVYSGFIAVGGDAAVDAARLFIWTDPGAQPRQWLLPAVAAVAAPIAHFGGMHIAAALLGHDAPRRHAGAQPAAPVAGTGDRGHCSAVQAFEQAAADYVLKPVNDARLARTVERLQGLLANRMEAADPLAQLVGKLQALMPASAAPERLDVVRAAVGSAVRMIPVADVVFFQATDKYVNLATADSEPRSGCRCGNCCPSSTRRASGRSTAAPW